METSEHYCITVCLFKYSEPVCDAAAELGFLSLPESRAQTVQNVISYIRHINLHLLTILTYCHDLVLVGVTYKKRQILDWQLD
jgi:hypothetical protein